jgi:hypothetical protein
VSGWDVIARTVDWRVLYRLRDGRDDDEAERLMEDEVIELGPAEVAAALVDELQPSPFGRQPSIYDVDEHGR